MNRRLKLMGSKRLNLYGPTWRFSIGGGAVNTPTAGGELLANGGMETDSGFASQGSPTTQERSNEQKYGGTYSRKVITDAATEGFYGNSNGNTASNQALGSWLKYIAWLYVTTGTARIIDASGNGGAAFIPSFITATSVWTKQVAICRDTTGAQNPGAKAGADAVNTFYVDGYSLTKLTLSSLFASILYSAYDVVASARVTFDSLSAVQAGLVLNLDSVSAPANFTLVYYNRRDGKIYVDKCVAGTYTNIKATTTTYAAGAILAATKSGTSVTVTYNGAAVGTAGTIDDAGIVSNKIHGLFSTGTPSQAQFSNFRLTG